MGNANPRKRKRSTAADDEIDSVNINKLSDEQRLKNLNAENTRKRKAKKEKRRAFNEKRRITRSVLFLLSFDLPNLNSC